MAGAAHDAPSTRQRILGAALSLFAERGVDATSLDAVAAQVGVRKQTLLYWFGSKEQLLFGVVDHAVDELGAELSAAAVGAGPTLDARVRAVVDATFRLGTLRPELLAVVREVTRLGPPASTHLARAAEPLVDAAAWALGGSEPADLGATGDRAHGASTGDRARPGDDRQANTAACMDPSPDRDRIGAVLLAAGARVVGLATEAQVRADLGLPADLRWLRTRRRELVAALLEDLT